MAKKNQINNTGPMDELETTFHQLAEPKKKRGKATVIILVILAILLAAGGVYFYFFQGLIPGRILHGITIAGVDVGGMTQEEAVAAVRSSGKAFYQQDMEVTIDPHIVTVSGDTFCPSLDAESAVLEAYEYGRKGSYEERKAQKMAAQAGNCAIALANYLTLDETAVAEALDQFLILFDSELRQTQYEVKGAFPDLTAPMESLKPQTLVLTKGTSLYTLDMESLNQAVLESYKVQNFSYTGQCQVQDPEDFDLAKVYDELCCDPVDAVMDPETFLISREALGYDFDLKLAQNRFKMLSQGKQLEIPLRFTQPEVTYQALYDSLFQDQLSTVTARSGSSYNRDTNMRIACEALNGLILYPGDEFSYNPTLGERTPEKGYLPAGSYAGLETVSTYGGGICQVASCVYYCALYADLEITQRHCHTFNTGYLPLGLDATIDWSGPNLRFINNTDYPIRIDAYAEGGSTTITFMGTDYKDYYVKMSNSVLDSTPYETREEYFPEDNPKGYKDGEVISTPYTGYKVVTYRNKYDKATDELISSEWEASSEYSKRDHVTARIGEPPEEETEEETEEDTAEDIPEDTPEEDTTD